MPRSCTRLDRCSSGLLLRSEGVQFLTSVHARPSLTPASGIRIPRTGLTTSGPWPLHPIRGMRPIPLVWLDGSLGRSAPSKEARMVAGSFVAFVYWSLAVIVLGGDRILAGAC